MRKGAVIAAIIAMLVMLGGIFFGLHRNKENEAQSDLVKFSMAFQNAHYFGGDEEVEQSIAGERIGTSATYCLDPDASKEQMKNGANYKAPVFEDRENDDYTSVIVLNHKGKYVRVYFCDISNYEEENLTDFSCVTDIFRLDQKQVEKVTVNDGREISEREQMDALLAALLKPYPYAEYYGDDYSDLTFAFKITVTFEGGDSFCFYIDRQTQLLNAYDACFQLTGQECGFFEEIAGFETAETTTTAPEEHTSEESVSTVETDTEETEPAETNCDGNPVWTFLDDSLGENWNRMLSGYSFAFDNWTMEGAEEREGFWFKHGLSPVVTNWSVYLYEEPSLEAERILVPVHIPLYAQATDRNAWIYFDDMTGGYSGWMHLLKEPNVMYRTETEKGLIQLDQAFDFCGSVMPGVIYGDLEPNNPILPADSDENYKMFEFSSTQELAEFIESYKTSMADSSLIADMEKFCEAWENDNLDIYTAKLFLMVYTAKHDVSAGTRTITLWRDPDQKQDMLRLNVYYEAGARAQDYVGYAFNNISAASENYENLALQLIEYDKEGPVE